MSCLHTGWAEARGGGILHLERLLEGQLDVEAAVLDSIAASAPLSTRLMAVSTATQAAALYLSAAAMPRSATRLSLSQDGLIIDGPMAMPPGHLSKSQFLFAFQSVASGRLVPRVIKLFSSPNLADRESGLWRDLGDEAASSLVALVPVTAIRIPRVSPRVAGLSPQGGLLMPIFSCTLSQIPDPVPPAFAHETVVQMSRVLYFLHDRGWWHGDVKPSNMFMDPDGAIFLGDYGTCVKYGSARANSVRFDDGNAGTIAFQCASVQPGRALFTPLRFDRTGLAIAMLVKVSCLALKDFPGYPGWPLDVLLQAARTIADGDLRAALVTLLTE